MVAKHAREPIAQYDHEADWRSADLAGTSSIQSGKLGKLLTVRRGRLVLAALINLVVPILLWLMFPLAEKTDDLTMKYILSGAFSGTPDGHLLYSSYLLGVVLALFQRVFPSFAWFELSQYFALYLGFTAFTYMVLDLKEVTSKKLIIGIVLLFFGFESYIRLTFTKTAGICIGSGFLLILHGSFETQLDRDKRIEYICGGVLIVLGSLFRHRMTFSALPIFLGLGIVTALIYNNDRAELARAVRTFVVVSMVPFVVAYGISKVGGLLFRLDDGWAAYKEYNPYKAALQDYGWPSYSNHQEEYEAIGVSYSDYEMWTNRDYGDSDILTVELWEQLASIKTPVSPIDYFRGLKGFFRTYPMALLDFRTIGAVIVVLAIYLISDSSHKTANLASLVTVYFLEYWYLYVNGRYNSNHVDTSMAYFFVCCICFLLHKASVNMRRTQIVTLFAVLICLWAINDNRNYIKTPTYNGSSYTIEKADAKRILATLSNDKDSLYIMSNDEYYGLLRGFGALESPKQGFFSNMFVLSSYMFPTHTSVLSSRGIDNIYKAFCDDNVYYVTSDAPGNAKAICSYLQEHYYPSATYELDHKVGSVSVYKFFSNEPMELELEPVPEPVVIEEPVPENTDEGYTGEEYVNWEEYSEEDVGW